MKKIFLFLLTVFIFITQNIYVLNECNAGRFVLRNGIKPKPTTQPTTKPVKTKIKTLKKKGVSNLPNEFELGNIKKEDIYAIVINGDNAKNSKQRHQNNVALAYNYFMSIGMNQKNICLIGYQDLIQQKITPTIKNIHQCLKNIGRQIALNKNNAGFIVYLTGHGQENSKNESGLVLQYNVKKPNNTTIEKIELLESSDFANLMRIYIPAQTFVVYIGDQCLGSDFPKYLEKMYFQGLGFSLTSKRQTGFCKKFSPVFWQNMIDGGVIGSSFARGLYNAFKNYINELRIDSHSYNNIPTVKYFPQSLNVGQIDYGSNNKLPIPEVNKIVHSIYKRSFKQVVAIEFTLTTCIPCKKLKKELPKFLFGYNGKVHWVRVTIPDNKTNLPEIFGWLSRTISDFPTNVSAFPTIFLIFDGKVSTKTHSLLGVAQYLDYKNISGDKASWELFPKKIKQQTVTQKTQRFNWISDEEFADYVKYNPAFSISDIQNLRKLNITPKDLFNVIDVFSDRLTFEEIKFIEKSGQIKVSLLKELKRNNVPVKFWKYASLKDFNIKLLLSYYANLDRIKYKYENNNYLDNTILSAVERNIPYSIFIGFPENMVLHERYRLYTNYWLSGWWYQNFPGITNEFVWIINRFDQKSIFYIIILMIASFFLGSWYKSVIYWFKIRALKKDILIIQKNNFKINKKFTDFLEDLNKQQVSTIKECLVELKNNKTIKESQTNIIIIIKD